MIKTLTFGDKTVQFSTSFAWCFVYKSQFGQDPARVFMPAIRKITDQGDEGAASAIYEEIGLVGVVQIAWAMAKLCDKQLPDPMTWVSSFGDDFAALDIVTELIPEAIQSCFSSKNLNPLPQKAPEEEKDQAKA